MRPGEARTGVARRELTAAQRAFVAVLLVAPALLVAWKCSTLPGAEALRGVLSLDGLDGQDLGRVHHLLVAPLAALFVVFCRVTLGLRVLGPFRSILLAMAFQATGPLVGLAFFTIVVGAVVFIRPRLKGLKMPFYGKSAAMLVCVTITVVAALLAGVSFGLAEVVRVAYFPIGVLTLTGESVAAAKRREGWRSAVWRSGLTAGVAVVIAVLTSPEMVSTTMARFPELVVLSLGLVVVVSRTMKLRLLQWLNPPRPKKRRRRSTSAGAPGIPDTGSAHPSHETAKQQNGEPPCVSQS